MSNQSSQPAPLKSLLPAASNAEIEAQQAARRRIILIGVGLATGVISSLAVAIALVVVLAIKNAGAEKDESRHIEHAEFTFRAPKGWTMHESTAAPMLYSFEAKDGSAASIQIESFRAWRGGPDFSAENFAQYLPGTSVRHQRDEMGGAEAQVGFSEEKNLGIWHCVAGTRHNGNDYFIKAQGPDREKLIDAVFLMRKTWRWKP